MSGALSDLRQRLRARQRGEPWRAPERLAELPAAGRLPAPDPADAERLGALAAEHPALHTALARLDAHQLRAVLADEPATLVQAQVGSGKTTVLVHKLLHLLRVEAVPLERVAVLTFTHKAAGEVRERLAAAGPDPPADAGWLVGTFHGVARALLRRVLPVEELGVTRAFRVLEAGEREELWLRLIAEHDLAVRYRRRLERRVEAWRAGRPLYGNMKRLDDLGRLLELYGAEKRRLDALDFDDLLREARRLLAAAPPDAAWRPTWLLVDELQDTSPEQLELLEALAAPGARWFAVGDPNQVIYSWRGGGADVFERFARRRGARRLELPVNYRSTRAILEGARPFLSAEAPGSGELTGVRPGGEPLLVVDHHDAPAEARYLAGRLRALHAAGVPWAELAVLFRTRGQAAPLREACARAGIPVVEGAPRGVEEDLAPAAWLRRLLQAGLDPADAAPARLALTSERYGVVRPGALPAADVAAVAARTGRGGLAAVRSLLGERLEACGRSRSVRRRARAPGWRAALTLAARLAELRLWLAVHGRGGAAPETLADALAAHLELAQALRPTTAGHAREAALARRFLARWLGEARARPERLPTALAAVLADGRALAPDDAGRRARAAPAGDGVRLLTLHAAKGLEFRCVFVVGANDGRLPLGSARFRPDALAEERRLFFVGLTRAKDALELSWHRAPDRPDVAPEPSPFLRELPRRCVRWLDPEELAARARPPAPAAAPADPPAGLEPAWRAGDRIRHARYGAGEVVAVDDAAVRCAFPGRGERAFALALCPLVREGGPRPGGER